MPRVHHLNTMPSQVDLELFEELADEGVRRMRDHGLQPSTLVSAISSGANPKDKGCNGVFVGTTKEGADTSSRDSDGVASKISAYLRSLTERGLGCMAYADATIYFMRGKGVEDAYDALLEKVGAEPKFVASSVSPSRVGIGFLEIGAASNKGRISIMMPVRCSVLGCWLRVRYVVCRDLVDTHVQPSDKFCEEALAAAQKMAAAENKLRDTYFETGLVYNKDGDAKGQNGPRAMIVGEYGGKKGPKKLRGQLRSALNFGPEMVRAVEKELNKVAATRGGAISIEDIHEAAKAAGSPSVAPNSAFAKPFRVAFDQFLGAVGKKLNKVGCMGSINTSSGKRAAQGDGPGSLGTGGKGSGKRGAKKPRAQPYGPKGRMANPLDMMQ